ncbi:MAG TPA: biliverdin-producing heme oxygenase [Kofleriaceae bacterium]|nr:biliverdin-producing heme oxygenase [Kofleriaceae bacterium]
MAVLGNPTREGFVHYLERVYGFDAPLESAFAIAPGLAQLVDLDHRVKTNYLAEDLRAVGIAPDRLLSLPHCSLAPFGDAIEALGWMYVAEIHASTHNLVVSQLARRTKDVVSSTAHLTYYDALGRGRWRELDGALAQVAVDDAASQRLIDSAMRAFDCVHYWLRPNTPSATALQVGSRTPPRLVAHRQPGSGARSRRLRLNTPDVTVNRDVAAREPARASTHVRRERTLGSTSRRS